VRVLLILTAASMVAFLISSGEPTTAANWLSAGQNVNNSRNQPNEEKIQTANVSSLTVKWTFVTQGDVSATPSVADTAVYFPDWGGKIYALHKETGRVIWARTISDFDSYPGSVSRVTPAIHGDDLVIGDIESASSLHNGANIMAINRTTGTLHWITQVETHPAAIITGSPVVLGDVVYVGVSSIEEALAANASYPCCSFRGSVVALDANTGRVIWQFYAVPAGYSGGGVWQPVAIDAVRGSVFVGTGNNYEVPSLVKSCLAAPNAAAAANCFDPSDHFDSALALDLNSGNMKWAQREQAADVWTVGCLSNPTPVSCPEPSSPDYDFSGSGPNLLPQMVGFGQKSGTYWAFNPDNGNLLWSTVAGPGGALGGMEWGTATDGQRIYVAITNSGGARYPLVNGTTITSGAWSALDVNTGKILWQTADPEGGQAMGAVSVANGVVYAPSLTGSMHALDAGTGALLWTFASGGSVMDGPSIADGTVYWGSGYRRTTGGKGNDRLYAFSVFEERRQRFRR
jgi:polyvinyl alcohol dehydrogenase (cytochrome)